MSVSPLVRAIDDFAVQLAKWRTDRKFSKRALAAAMGFDPSYVSHVEARRHRPTEDFARRAENVLNAGGAIWRSYAAYEALRQSAPLAAMHAPMPRREADNWSVPGVGLIVDEEYATIALRQGRYHVAVRRQLYNAGVEPIVRFPVRIRTDLVPRQVRRSTRAAHSSTVSWSELDFSARHQAGAGTMAADGPSIDVMTWRSGRDSGATKELWLHFANEDRQFPLYPGQRSTIEYAYHVSDDKWVPEFLRAIRTPTRNLRVELDFPADTQVAVWGTVSSMAAESTPLSTPIQVAQDADLMTFSWSVRAPMLGARYRFEWRFRG